MIDAEDALFVGHDWGSMVVSDLSRLHPERVRGLVNMSVPYTAWPARPTDVFRALFGDRFFHILYFLDVGPAERELEVDVAETPRLTLWGGSGEMFGPPPDRLPPVDGTRFLDAITRGAAVPDGLPSWLTADDLATDAEQSSTSGFSGPLSWYRNLDADYELTKDLPPPSVPSAFIGGTLDGVIAARLDTLDEAHADLADYRGSILVGGAGHWTQQERPTEFNAALLELLTRVS